METDPYLLFLEYIKKESVLDDSFVSLLRKAYLAGYEAGHKERMRLRWEEQDQK